MNIAESVTSNVATGIEHLVRAKIIIVFITVASWVLFSIFYMGVLVSVQSQVTIFVTSYMDSDYTPYVCSIGLATTYVGCMFGSIYLSLRLLNCYYADAIIAHNKYIQAAVPTPKEVKAAEDVIREMADSVVDSVDEVEE